MKIGIMIVGLNGVNASTLISGSTLMQLGEISEQYGITSSATLRSIEFSRVNDFIFSGWDYFDKNQYEMLKEYGIVKFSNSEQLENSLKRIKPFKGIHTNKDIVLEEKFDHFIVPESVIEAIAIIENNIDEFKNRFSLETVIVFYLGSPSKKVYNKLKKMDYNDILKRDIDEIPSGLLYAIASIRRQAHFVDFTPSETLEFDFLWALAKQYGVQLSGRDGSTGQTMLKLTIANMLKIRNLKLNAWYSTNILGNHDGYVLSDAKYCETKIEDKMNGIAPLLGYDDFEHKVTIDFFKTRFDSKESWDSVDFSGWLDTPMKLKMNWEGEDSILSAPLLLDIIRLIAFGAKKDLKGFQKQLGLFYKHPFGCEGMSLETMYNSLIQFYKGL